MIIFLLFLGTSAGILNSCDAREALLLFAYKDFFFPNLQRALLFEMPENLGFLSKKKDLL